MKNLFSYDSKFMQIMLLLADYIILNVIFILCCIPIFTIGAAQAGLYSGMRVLLDREDDSSCVRAFFRGFASVFGKITIVWIVMLVIMALLGYNLVAVLILEAAGAFAPKWMCIVGLVILAIYQSMLTLFHSKFGCTIRQLLKNAFYIILAHPLRSIAVAALTWAPVLVFAFAFDIFIQATPAWIVCYYSIAFGLNVKLMNKPFQTVTENFVAAYEAEHGEIVLEEEVK